VASAPTARRAKISLRYPTLKKAHEAHAAAGYPNLKKGLEKEALGS